jgi:hypothetical protein
MERSEIAEQIMVIDQERNKKRAALLEMKSDTSDKCYVDCGGFFVQLPKAVTERNLAAGIPLVCFFCNWDNPHPRQMWNACRKRFKFCENGWAFHKRRASRRSIESQTAPVTKIGEGLSREIGVSGTRTKFDRSRRIETGVEVY